MNLNEIKDNLIDSIDPWISHSGLSPADQADIYQYLIDEFQENLQRLAAGG